MNIFQQKFTNTESKSDKISHHGFQRIYPWILNNFKDDSINLLEIGLDKNESLKLWKNYFPNAKIFGIDRDPIEFKDEIVRFFKVDQSNTDELESFKKNVEVSFDLIIDDGSHSPDHQIKTLNSFWSILNPRGVYIIEDIETSYWGKSDIYGYQFNANKTSNNIIDQLKGCIDIINKEFLGSKSTIKNSSIEQSVSNDIEMICFGYNSVILIKKDAQLFGEFYNRQGYQYAYKKNRETSLKKLIRFARSIFKK
jgi:hypothetical protein